MIVLQQSLRTSGLALPALKRSLPSHLFQTSRNPPCRLLLHAAQTVPLACDRATATAWVGGGFPTADSPAAVAFVFHAKSSGRFPWRSGSMCRFSTAEAADLRVSVTFAVSNPLTTGAFPACDRGLPPHGFSVKADPAS
ncbi:MAG: hypothetical protein ACF8TS_18560 [Maioricimonas sp. JB049]